MRTRYYVETETTQRFGRVFDYYVCAYIYAQLIGLRSIFPRGIPERIDIYSFKVEP